MPIAPGNRIDRFQCELQRSAASIHWPCQTGCGLPEPFVFACPRFVRERLPTDCNSQPIGKVDHSDFYWRKLGRVVSAPRLNSPVNRMVAQHHSILGA
jgi:hypothetical protein